MSYRVVVDLERCESNALCMAICPEVFQLGDDDTLAVLHERPAESLRAMVEGAVAQCPRHAIEIVESDGCEPPT